MDHPLLREAQDDLSWEAMFREMAINIGDKKKIVVIDEFQYIGKVTRPSRPYFEKFGTQFRRAEI